MGKTLKIILMVLAVLAVAAVVSLNAVARKAPEILRQKIEQALSRKVQIGAIRYHFPMAFELSGFRIEENAPFQGEISFGVDELWLFVSPMSLSKKALVIDRITVDNAHVIIRQYRGKLFHSLSDAARRPPEESAAQAGEAPPKPRGVPLEIREFRLRKSHFQFVDYDAVQGGFVMVLDGINTDIKNIALPFSSKRTSYQLSAALLQERDQRPADVQISGWTEFASLDTDANFSLRGVHLPYFRPYYAKVTQAVIHEGYMDSRMNLRIDKKELAANADFEVNQLYFQSYELGDELFGLRADEILSFLKDSAGRLKFQIVVRFNIADRSVRAKDVIRRSIEHSLKNTILGNIENILQHTIRRIGEGGVTQTKEDFEGRIKKIKDLFKFD